ncbi:hypothetical protein LTS08_006042 [Lithohypha guttulata]|nr:hypothetical protein LTS08_006042 [Lithohypha guttulata]
MPVVGLVARQEEEAPMGEEDLDVAEQLDETVVLQRKLKALEKEIARMKARTSRA